LSWLLDYNRDFTTPFEHYWCLRTLTDLSPQMTVTQRRRMASDLAARWTEISGDPGRVDLASALREWPESDTSVAMGARARRRATTRPAQSSQASEEGQTAADTGRPPSPPNPTETGRPRTTQSTLGGKMPSVAKEVTSVEKSVGEVRAQTKSRRSKK